jgi:hypothetical protein
VQTGCVINPKESKKEIERWEENDRYERRKMHHEVDN